MKEIYVSERFQQRVCEYIQKKDTHLKPSLLKKLVEII